MVRRLAAAATLGVLALAAVGSGRAAAPPLGAPQLAAAPTAADRLIVRFEPGASASERAATRRAADVRVERSLPLDGLQLVRPAPGVSLAQAAGRLRRASAVRYVEPDFPRVAFAIPDDPLFGQLWGLHNTAQLVAGRSGGSTDADIDAPEAWDLTTGSAGVTVAVVDTGIDAGHPDLAPNLWRNADEIAANRIDDDRNGLTDDVHGWDFADDDPAPDDDNGHGTHVAGTIGARGNDGIGVSGVAWRTALMPLRVLGADGSGSVSDLVGAYLYAHRKGIRILNVSLGGDRFSRAERDAIAAASQTLVVAAAGNEGADNDAIGSFPCNYDLPNVICVAATGRDGALAAFSNHGAGTVDLGAPGTEIASTYPGGTYAIFDGTSMAAPHVSGTAALVWARDPAASVADVRTALLGSVIPAPSLAGVTVTGGVVNAQAAVRAVGPDPDPEPEPEPAPPAPAATTVTPLVPPPAPAPTVAPDVAPDVTAPRIVLATPTRITRRAAVTRGLRVRVRCSEACALRGELRHGRVLIGRGRGGRASAGVAPVVVKLTRAGSRRMRSRVPVRIVLRVRAVDTAGNARTTRRGVTLR